jgi:hypothetical protein
MPKPPARLTMSKADEVRVGSWPEDVVLQTPVTPVLAEALVSLQDLILQQDAHALDETSRQSLKKHLQKFTKAARVSFANGVL